ncbi:MAG: hypothetical protein QOH88_3172 [Verrucomicrobiota bacterium]|jgi:DNA-binding NarL/FixJ family response regulator
MRVLIVDDHALFRAGLRSILEKMREVEVVGEASNGRDALALIRSELPNLVLLDIAMPELGGLETLPRIIKDFPSVKVVILSAHSNEDYVRRAFRSGASGYLLKDSATDELALVIKSVKRGDVYLSPLISQIVTDGYFAWGGAGASSLERLTSRQREVLQLIAEGRTTKEVAAALEISPKTVDVHRLQIMTRLNIYNMPGLVRYAIRNHLAEA